MRPPAFPPCERVILYGCLLLLWPLSVQGQQYVEITADLNLAAYSGRDTNGAANAKPRSVAVVCITSAKEWRIEEDWVRDSLTKWFYDGTNVYNRLQVTKPMEKETAERISRSMRLAQVPFEEAKNHATINVWPSGDGHPMGDVAVNISWLAFCSGTYLKREGRLVPLPMEILHHTRDRFAYTDKTETFQDSFGLPRTVDLYLSRSLFLTSETDFDKEYNFGDRYTEWTKKTAEKLEEGAHMFHYAVTETTNFLGWTFPTKFEFYQNGRKFEQNGDWYWRGTGRVKSIKPSKKPEGLFDPTVQQTVVDWRFRDTASAVNGLIYTSTNRSLSPTNNPELHEKFTRRVERMKDR